MGTLLFKIYPFYEWFIELILFIDLSPTTTMEELHVPDIGNIDEKKLRILRSFRNEAMFGADKTDTQCDNLFIAVYLTSTVKHINATLDLSGTCLAYLTRQLDSQANNSNKRFINLSEIMAALSYILKYNYFRCIDSRLDVLRKEKSNLVIKEQDGDGYCFNTAVTNASAKATISDLVRDMPFNEFLVPIEKTDMDEIISIPFKDLPMEEVVVKTLRKLPFRKLLTFMHHHYIIVFYCYLLSKYCRFLKNGGGKFCWRHHTKPSECHEGYILHFVPTIVAKGNATIGDSEL